MVGYQNKPARNNFNYVTPSFRPISGMTGTDQNEMSINEVQMSADVGMNMANLQFLNDAGGKAVKYTWIPSSEKETYTDVTFPEGANGAWAVQYKDGKKNKYRDPNGSAEEPKTMSVAYGVQIEAAEGNTINFAGQVGEETTEVMTRNARNNFNYIGNPFSTDIPLNNIQMSDDVGMNMANMQFLTDAGGKYVKYTWIPISEKDTYTDVTFPDPAVMPNATGAWAVQYKDGKKNKYRDPMGDETEPAIIKAAECVQIEAAEGNKFWILCPYDL